MTDIKDYGMFTDEGNQFIADIVKHAKTNRLNWDEVVTILQRVSGYSDLGEAMDTVVRESVYIELFD